MRTTHVEGVSLTSDRRSKKVTFGVALDNTVLARTTVPSCSSTPSTTLFFTMICCTGYMERGEVERREMEEGGGGNGGREEGVKERSARES